jgi:hypothetical protein
MSYKFSEDPLSPAFLRMYESSLKDQIGGVNSAFCKIAEMYAQLHNCELPTRMNLTGAYLWWFGKFLPMIESDAF